jgi:hypothetical protein
MTRLVFSHPYLITDASTALNLYASGRMAEIIASVPVPVALAQYVKEVELRWVYSVPVPGTGKQTREPIDLQPLIDGGYLVVESLQAGNEEVTSVNLSVVLDDGEADTAAIALHRNWAIGVDDRQAQSYLRRAMPQLQLVSTPDLLLNWATVGAPSSSIVREVLRTIEVCGKYVPNRNHPLAQWWQDSR